MVVRAVWGQLNPSCANGSHTEYCDLKCGAIIGGLANEKTLNDEGGPEGTEDRWDFEN